MIPSWKFSGIIFLTEFERLEREQKKNHIFLNISIIVWIIYILKKN